MNHKQKGEQAGFFLTVSVFYLYLNKCPAVQQHGNYPEDSRCSCLGGEHTFSPHQPQNNINSAHSVSEGEGGFPSRPKGE